VRKDKQTDIQNLSLTFNFTAVGVDNRAKTLRVTNNEKYITIILLTLRRRWSHGDSRSAGISIHNENHFCSDGTIASRSTETCGQWREFSRQCLGL